MQLGDLVCAQWADIRAFLGTFNGLGHTITELTIARPLVTFIGLSGEAGSTAVIQNVGLTNANASGDFAVGALVGANYGSVRNSYANSTGAVTETSSNILTVAGEGTTTAPNPDVCVNGTCDVEISAL